MTDTKKTKAISDDDLETAVGGTDRGDGPYKGSDIFASDGGLGTTRRSKTDKPVDPKGVQSPSDQV